MDHIASSRTPEGQTHDVAAEVLAPVPAEFFKPEGAEQYEQLPYRRRIAMTDGGQRGVDEYIATTPREAQPILRQLRQVIKSAAPKAEERISYGMPTYEYHGRLVYFAAHKRHVALYSLAHADHTPAKELKEFMTGRATLRFAIDRPLPVALISRLVRARVKENEAKVKEGDGTSGARSGEGRL